MSFVVSLKQVLLSIDNTFDVYLVKTCLLVFDDIPFPTQPCLISGWNYSKMCLDEIVIKCKPNNVCLNQFSTHVM